MPGKKSAKIKKETKTKKEGKEKIRPEKKVSKSRKKDREAQEDKKAAAAASKLPSDKEKRRKPSYICGIGRRKEAIARIRVYKNGSGVITVNGKDFKEYFPALEQQTIITGALKSVGQANKLNVTVKVVGGGKKGQAESIRLGTARALLKLNPIFRKNLKKTGFLTRDPRVKERKKFGLKRARRAPQWQKR